MRKFMFVLIVGAVMGAFAAGSVVSAGEAPQVPKIERIGVVYIQQVFKNYRYAQDTEATIKSKFQPEQTRIESEIARVQEMERALQNNPLKPPGSAPWRKEMMQIEGAKVEVQSMQEEFANRVREEEAAFWVNMYGAFQRACKIIGEYYKFDIIIASPDAELSEEAVRAKDPMAIQQEILMRRIQYVNNETANLTASFVELMNHRYNAYLSDPNKNPLL